MGEEIITGNEQIGSGQVDIPATTGNNAIKEATATDTELTEVSNIPEINEYLKAQEAKEAKTEPKIEPIKIGDKEYTQEQIAELIKNSEATEKLEEKPTESPIRELAQVETEFKQTNDKAVSDFRSLFERFMARATAPVNPYTQQPDPTLVQRVLQNAGTSGDFTEFMKLLNPADQVEFLKEKINLENNYYPQLEALEKEKETVGKQKAYKENISKWDAFISEKLKDDAPAQHFFNHGKNTAYFDEAYAQEIYQKFQEAVAMAVNNKELNSQTEAVKKAMAGVNTAPAAQPRIFTRADIKAMSPAEFDKNTEEIFRQMNEGILK